MLSLLIFHIAIFFFFDLAFLLCRDEDALGALSSVSELSEASDGASTGAESDRWRCRRRLLVDEEEGTGEGVGSNRVLEPKPAIPDAPDGRRSQGNPRKCDCASSKRISIADESIRTPRPWPRCCGATRRPLITLW